MHTKWTKRQKWHEQKIKNKNFRITYKHIETMKESKKKATDRILNKEAAVWPVRCSQCPNVNMHWVTKRKQTKWYGTSKRIERYVKC